MVEIDVDVVGYVEIEIAVIVIVAERRAGPPASGISNARLGRDIGKRSVVIVVIEDSAVEISNVKIFPAIVVVVADGYAESPAAVRESRFRRHVTERAIVIIAVKLARMAFAGVHILDRRSVHENKCPSSHRCRSRRRQRRRTSSP